MSASKTVLMSDSLQQTIDVPQSGLFLDFSRYTDGTEKTFDCTFSFTIPAGSTLYMQNAGSQGAEVFNWIGQDHYSQSGTGVVSFKMKRTAGGAQPIFIYAINVHDPDRNNVYKAFNLDIFCTAR